MSPPSLSTYGEVFVARCIALVGPFGTAVITARMLGPEDRGRYYYVITLATIGAQLASLGIHSSNTFLVARQPELAPRIFVNTGWIAALGGIAAAGGVIIFDQVLGDTARGQASNAFVFALCPLTLLFLYLSNLAVAIARPRVFNGLIIFNSAMSLATALAAGIWTASLTLFLTAAVATGLLSCAAAWIFLLPRDRASWRFDRALFAKSIAFALRAHAIILLGFLMMRTAPVILRQDEAFGDLGQWSVAAQIAEALLLLPATVSLLLYPTLVRAEHEARWLELKITLLRIGVVMGLVCAAAGLAAAPAIELAFGAEYRPAVGITHALLPAVFLLSLTSVASQFLTALGIPASQIAGWIVAWGAQIVLSFAMLKSYGVVGLAWAQSAAAGLACIWMLVAALRHSPGRASCVAERT
jgi:O-antigen/teichoic acid export membrane protein